LIDAACAGHLAVVRKLLEAGADVTATNKVGVRDRLSVLTVVHD
jgi:ankyrin repeat protein